MVRVAVTVGLLRVPPSYFIVEQARVSREGVEYCFFACGADVAEPLPAPLSVPRSGTSIRSRLGRLVALGNTPRVARSIVRWGPDVVHQHFATWSSPARWAARRLRIPLVVTLHGYDVRPPRPSTIGGRVLGRFHAWELRRLVQEGARFIAVSDYLRDEAVKIGIPAHRVSTVYMGVDGTFFTPGSRVSSVAQEQRRVVFLGRMTPAKGGADLIEAVASVDWTRPPELVFIGTGPSLDDWKALASDLQVAVDFRGRQSHAEVRTSLREAAVVVLPTKEFRGWREAAGLAILEAQACGVPVVVYGSGGTSEMLRDGRTGEVVEEGNITELARALEHLLNLPAGEYDEKCREAVAFATSMTIQRSADEVITIYHQGDDGT